MSREKLFEVAQNIIMEMDLGDWEDYNLRAREFFDNISVEDLEDLKEIEEIEEVKQVFLCHEYLKNLQETEDFEFDEGAETSRFEDFTSKLECSQDIQDFIDETEDFWSYAL
jgi:hypothetical protein